MFKSSLELIQKFNVVKAIERANEKAIIGLGINITNEAKSMAPVKDGRLRNSIMYRTSTTEGGFNDSGKTLSDRKIDARATRGHGFVGINLDYAVYIEFGTRFMRPQPYLRPAIAVWRYGKALNEVKKDIKEEMDKGPLKGDGKRVKFY